jgi:hypothetical protein
MSNNPKPKQDRDNRDDHGHDNDPANDNGEHANDNGEHKKPVAIVPALAGGALTSIAALQTALNNVDTSAAGRSARPLLLFKSRENNGTWLYGRRQTVVEEDSRWAVNPTTFEWGSICFGNDNKVLGEHLVSVAKPKPDVTKLPDKGAPWQDEWAVNVKCLDGTDAGVEAVLKVTTVGGNQAVEQLIDMVRDRLNSGQHGGDVAPVVLLEKDSYPHRDHGRIWVPVLSVVDWMPLDGPAPTPEPTSPAPTPPPPAAQSAAAEQPRRRRRVA